MKYEFKVLASNGLARRTFVIVSLTVVSIVIGVLWFTTHWSAQYVEAQAARETATDAKRYGLGVFQRLELAAIALETLAEANVPNEGHLDTISQPYFVSLRSGPASAARHRAQVRIVQDSIGQLVIELSYSADSQSLVAQLSPEYLWQAEGLPTDLGVTVFDSSGHKLFEQLLAGQPTSDTTKDGDYRATWQLFLRERFGTDAWRVELRATLGERAISLERFRALLLAALVPLLAGMGWLASVLIRRSHRPLERLIAATRDIATQRFDVQVEESGDPDSRELIKAFNEMIRRIARQWHDMEVWSLHDELTQLPNRRHLRQFLDTTIARCAQSRGSFALLFLDLDRFKLVNDAIGHSIGDQLLRDVADRLRHAIAPNDFLGRLGGDEFTLVIPDVNERAQIERGVQRVLNALKDPFALGAHSHVASASIGIAVYPEDGSDPDTLLRNADSAMYRAKRSGTLRYAFYEAHMNASALERVRLERDLREAIANDELQLHYQPQVDLGSGAVRGAEALLRWNHREFGLLAPERFLAIAEDTGLIVPIGEWVIETACRDYRRWRNEGVDLESFAINASIAQLMSPQFVTRVRDSLTRHHVPRGVLEVEVTETAFAHDIDTIARVLAELREAGIRIAIDDFGVGYSSLNYLQRLSFDVLKIDRTFIPAHPAHEDGALCESIIAIANALHKRVIAEGIEQPAQGKYLLERGCLMGQGFLYSQPLPAAAFALYCRTHNQVTTPSVGAAISGPG